MQSSVEFTANLRVISSSRAFCWLARRRGLLASLLGAVAVADVLWGRARPVDLFGADASRLAPWLLALVFLGVSVRVWGAGNLNKRSEVTRTGVYRMVRHPLYLGNSLIFLAFFLSFGHPALDIPLFLLIFALHYPAMLYEERLLASRYPAALAAHETVPRLIPDLRALPAALATDRFCPRRAMRNKAFRSFGAFLLPLVTEVLSRLQGLL